MRLLTPKNAESAYRERQNELVGQLSLVSQEIIKETAKLNEAKALYASEVSAMRTAIEAEKTRLLASRDALTKEVSLLEKRREKALSPISALMDEADRKTAWNLSKEAELNERELKLDIRDEETRHRNRHEAEAMDQERRETSKALRKATSDMERAVAAFSEAERDREDARRIRQEALSMEERTRMALDEREKSLMVREASVEMETSRLKVLSQALRDEDKRLKSREASVNHAFQEGRKKGYL